MRPTAVIAGTVDTKVAVLILVPSRLAAGSSLRRWVRGLAYAAAALWAAPALGVHCAVDQVPAATLLVPYFEVHLDDPQAQNTIFWATNTSSAATVAHVTLWTDWGIPVLTYDVYLTGHDVQSIALRDVIVDGFMAQTASDAQDPTDVISPQGPLSDDAAFASCDGLLPPPNLPAGSIAHLEAALTGQPSALLGGKCAGGDHDDRVARGYVTIDAVTGCTLLDPSDVGYFDDVAVDANVLVGEAWLIESTSPGFVAYSIPVAHLEAGALAPGSRSFYGRLVGDSGIDGREPLPASFGARFARPAGASSRWIVWREVGPESGAVTCGTQPAWAPLATRPLLLFDDQTQSTNAPVALPLAAQLLDLATGGGNPYEHGRALLDLDHGGLSRPAQGYVVSLATPLGSPAESLDVLPLDGACTGGSHYPLLRDGFENGLLPWAEVSP
jgi:hypothetical protein